MKYCYEKKRVYCSTDARNSVSWKKQQHCGNSGCQYTTLYALTQTQANRFYHIHFHESQWLMHVEYWQIRYITEIVTQSKCVAQSRKKCQSSQHIDIWLLHLSLSFCCLSFWALLLIATHHDVRAVCKNMLPAQQKMRLATAVMVGIFIFCWHFRKEINEFVNTSIESISISIDKQVLFETGHPLNE